MANDENFAKLNDIFAENHGNHVVYLFIKDKNQKIKTNASYWMNDSADIIAAVENLFGKGSILKR